MLVKYLFADKKFTPFFWTQFLGAFNDNLLKNTLVMLITYRSVDLMGLELGAVISLASALFILPFVLFSPLAGQISDKYDKSVVARYVKFAEIIIMGIACCGFYFESYALLLFVLFCTGVQSTFFGPLKYSIIPSLAGEKNVLQANAIVEMGTFISILTGTILGGYISSLSHVESIVSIGVLVTACVGYWTSRKIPPQDENLDLNINYNPLPEIISLWKMTVSRVTLLHSIVGVSWFWLYGVVVLSVLPIYVSQDLHGSESVATLFFAAFTVGIAVGSLVCERLSRCMKPRRLVFLGALGLSLSYIDLYLIPEKLNFIELNVSTLFSHWQPMHILLDFFFFAVAGGIFIVPLYTILQQDSKVVERSRVIAANNILNALFMVIGSLAVAVAYGQGLGAPLILLVFAIINLLFCVPFYFWFYRSCKTESM